MTADQSSTRTAPLHFGSSHGAAGRKARASRFPLLFRLLHLAGLVVTLPVVAASRLLPRYRRAHADESIFAETNCAVLTALEIGFMA